MSSVIGVSRSCICLVLEHPFESIKTQWQTKVEIKGMKEIVKSIINEKGLIGFYRGFIPNLIRVSIKQTYRWPMMLYFPHLYKKNLPYKSEGFVKILTGLTIANIEVLIICPLDRLKIYFMTHDKVKKHIFAYFISTHRGNFLKELFVGLGPSYWRSNASWVSFLYLDQFTKNQLKSYKKTDHLNFLDLFFTSVIVSIGNLGASKLFINLAMPFDFAKTHSQKDGNIKDSTFSILRQFYKTYGFAKLYTGWQFRMLQYTLQSVFTVTTLEYLEIKSKQYI
jgi:hypothetical protein